MGRTKKEEVITEPTDNNTLQSSLDIFDTFDIEEINHDLTTTNDINEIYRIFGIEAAREAIINEILFCFKAYNIYSNSRNLNIIIDIMTSKGFLIPMTRYGMKTLKPSVLKEISFESIKNCCIEAALMHKTDGVCDNSTRISLGMVPEIGTNYFDVLLDDKMLKEESKNKTKIDKNNINNDFIKDYVVEHNNYKDDENPFSLTNLSLSDEFFNNYERREREENERKNSGVYTPTYSSTTQNFIQSTSPSSPLYTPSSPNYTETPVLYSPSTPNETPTSPNYTPTSVYYNQNQNNNYVNNRSVPNYTQQIPNYAPSSPKNNQEVRDVKLDDITDEVMNDPNFKTKFDDDVKKYLKKK